MYNILKLLNRNSHNLVLLFDLSSTFVLFSYGKIYCCSRNSNNFVFIHASELSIALPLYNDVAIARFEPVTIDAIDGDRTHYINLLTDRYLTAGPLCES